MKYLCSSCQEIMPSGDGQDCPSCGVWGYPIITKDPPKVKSSYTMPRGKLKPVSSKQRNLLVSYKESGPMGPQEACAKCGTHDHLTKHHVAGRSGMYEGRPAIEIWVWACMTCHDSWHANPNQALKEGWLQYEYRGIKHDESRHGPRKKPWEKQN